MFVRGVDRTDGGGVQSISRRIDRAGQEDAARRQRGGDLRQIGVKQDAWNEIGERCLVGLGFDDAAIGKEAAGEIDIGDGGIQCVSGGGLGACVQRSTCLNGRGRVRMGSMK